MLDRSRRQIELHTRLPKYAALTVSLLMVLLGAPGVARAQDPGPPATRAGNTQFHLGAATGTFSFKQDGNKVKTGLMLKGKVPKGTKATVTVKLSIWTQHGANGTPHKIVGTTLLRTYSARTSFSLGVPRNNAKATFAPDSQNWIEWEASYADKSGVNIQGPRRTDLLPS